MFLFGQQTRYHIHVIWGYVSFQSCASQMFDTLVVALQNMSVSLKD